MTSTRAIKRVASSFAISAMIFALVISRPFSHHFRVDAFAPRRSMPIRNNGIHRGKELGPKNMFFQMAMQNNNDDGYNGVKLSENSNDKIRPVLPITQRTRFQGLLALAAIITASNNSLQFQSVPVAESLLALISSIVLVSGATDAVERITAANAIKNDNMPSYDVNGERFDQSQFGGRFCKMLLACDPRLLLYTEEEVRKYRKLAYEEWKDVKKSSSKDYNSIHLEGKMFTSIQQQQTTSTTKLTAETDRILWEAKRIADSALHPTTQEWVPRPFRMSGYLPFNGPICIAMISVTDTLLLLFWSWMNQSQNALVNYFNGPRSSSKGDDATISNNDNSNNMDGTLLKSYVIAVTSALIVAFGLATYIESNYSGEEATELLRFISFPSAVIASSLNCYIVRSPEIDTGVPLLNPQTMQNVLPGETSSIAAKRGVYFTTASRAVLQMPTYFIPPLILDTVGPLKEYLNENPTMVVPITTFLLLLSFGIGLPCAVGLFPQVSCIPNQDVEEKFQSLGYEEFYYNKGL